jgi:hypothetical protein
MLPCRGDDRRCVQTTLTTGGAKASVRRIKCRNCQELFQPDARNQGRQKYCSKASCRAASKAHSQRRWLARPGNENYFRDGENAARVRRWQRANPGYWRNTRRYKCRTLQDPCRQQLADINEDIGFLALQETLRQQGPVLLGLIATLTDSALQEDMVAASRRLLQLGQDILGGRRADAHQTGAAP